MAYEDVMLDDWSIYVTDKPNEGEVELGTGAVALGVGNKALNWGATAIGIENTAEGEFSFAAGRSNKVQSYSSVAMGIRNEITHKAKFATAIGRENVADGPYSVLLGLGNETGMTPNEGSGAFASGVETKAMAIGAHSRNYQTKALARYSTAGGLGTVADKDAQTVIGRYNASDPDALFIVGNGTDENNRSNALTVKEDGTIALGSGDAVVKCGNSGNLTWRAWSSGLCECWYRGTQSLTFRAIGGQSEAPLNISLPVLNANTPLMIDTNYSVFCTGSSFLCNGSYVNYSASGRSWVSLNVLTCNDYAGKTFDGLIHLYVVGRWK